MNIFREAKKRNIKFKLVFGNAASKSMDFFAIKKLKKEKVSFLKLDYSHNSINLFKDTKSIFKIKKMVNLYRPTIIHSASPKANLISSIISKITKTDKLVLSISGLGYLFTNQKKFFFSSLKSNIYLLILKFCIKNQNKKIIVQNKEDYKFIKFKLNLKRKEIFLIKGGSGVNLSEFENLKKNQTKNISMISRIVSNKGVKEYLKSAEILKTKFPNWNFILLGSKDYKSPDQIDVKFLNYFTKKKIVKIFNFKDNIKEILKNTEIFCLPSYREGMPKAVLEALSAGIPVVTTNVTGCKDSIINNYNGLLCRPFSHIDLANKIEKLVLNKSLRNRLSKNAKYYAKKNFSINDVTNNIYRIYNLK